MFHAALPALRCRGSFTPPFPAQERYCPDLEEEERKQLRAFSARRRRDALGQGVAVPVPGARHGCPCRKVRPLPHGQRGAAPETQPDPDPVHCSAAGG